MGDESKVGEARAGFEKGEPPQRRRFDFPLSTVLAFEAGQEDARTAAGWQPIETAPKDGTHVVLFGTLQGDPNQIPRACVSWYCRERTDGPVYCLGWFFSSPGYGNGFNPTHWMPLPSAVDELRRARSVDSKEPSQATHAATGHVDA